MSQNSAQPQAVHLDKISYVTLFVTDQDKAIDFYCTKLGFEKRGDNQVPNGPRFVVVGLKGQPLQVSLWPGTKGVSAKAPGYLPGVIFVESPDVEAAFAGLKARGVTFEETRPAHMPFGTYITALDPDGNRISIRQDPPQPPTGAPPAAKA
jgi:catechol 2,3-dioxygenase-like lactoylglutathione lyase family enzyme